MILFDRLVVGPPCGRIHDLFAKVNAINAKYGPFEVLLVLGDLFKPYEDGDDLSREERDLLSGDLSSAIPLYFAQPPSPLHPDVVSALVSTGKLDGSNETAEDKPLQVTASLFFLRQGLVSAVSGLRLAALGGKWDAQHYAESNDHGDQQSAVQALLNPYLTAANVKSLLDHPSFKEPVTSSTAQERYTQAEPTSLAAARAQMAKQASLLQQQAEQEAKSSVDILLTNTWPSGVTMFSNIDKLPHPTSRVWGSPVVARLARNAEPRYHFALAPGSTGLPDVRKDMDSLGIIGLDGTEQGDDLRRTGAFWEREPYRAEGRSHSVSRFVSLARFGNEKKTRWFMALSLGKSSEGNKRPQAVPENATPSPYASSSLSSSAIESSKRKSYADASEMDSGINYRWAETGKKARHNGKGFPNLPQRPDVTMPDRPRQPVHAVAPADCWFCLSNAQCAKHLIVTIGTECYVAMPKGQLPSTSDGSSPIPGGGHVLIIPIEHIASLRGSDDDAGRRSIAQEMEQWRSALRKAYSSFNAVMVSWEICRTSNTRAGHMQCQVLPIPRRRFDGLKQYVREMAKEADYEFEEDQERAKRFFSLDEQTGHDDYFRFDFDGETWLMLIKPERRFNLQFPRQTLAAYLGTPDRADWRKCARSEAIETAENKAFKSAFQEFAAEVEES
jgi:hypothetical protein